MGRLSMLEAKIPPTTDFHIARVRRGGMFRDTSGKLGRFQLPPAAPFTPGPAAGRSVPSFPARKAEHRTQDPVPYGGGPRSRPAGPGRSPPRASPAGPFRAVRGLRTKREAGPRLPRRAQGLPWSSAGVGSGWRGGRGEVGSVNRSGRWRGWQPGRGLCCSARRSGARQGCARPTPGEHAHRRSARRLAGRGLAAGPGASTGAQFRWLAPGGSSQEPLSCG